MKSESSNTEDLTCDESAMTKTKDVLADRTEFELEDKQWCAFNSALNRPAQDKPALRALLRVLQQ